MNWKVYSIFSEKPEVDIILWKIKSRLKIIWFENLACMTQYKVQIVPRVFFLKGGEERDRDRVQPTRAEGCVTSQCLFKEEFWVSSDATAWVSAGLSGTRTSVLMTYIHETASQTQKATWLELLHSFTQNSTKFTWFYNSLLRNIFKETKLPAPVGISQKNLIGQQ